MVILIGVIDSVWHTTVRDNQAVNNLMSAIEKRLRNEQDKKKNSSETNVIILKQILVSGIGAACT